MRKGLQFVRLKGRAYIAEIDDGKGTAGTGDGLLKEQAQRQHGGDSAHDAGWVEV